MKENKHLRIPNIYGINDQVPAFDLGSIIHAPKSWILTLTFGDSLLAQKDIVWHVKCFVIDY